MILSYRNQNANTQDNENPISKWLRVSYLRWFLLIVLLLSASTSAHVRDLILTEYRIEESRVELTMVLPFQALQGFDDNKDGTLSADEARRHQESIVQALNPHIQLRDGTQLAELSAGSLPSDYSVPDMGLLPGSHGAIQLVFTFQRPIQELDVHYDYFPFPELCIAKFYRGQEVQTYTFSPTQTDFRVGGEKGSLSNFFWMGVAHLFTGPDHLLFLFALLCCAPEFKATLKTITAFTVAHSLTLLLAALQWVQVSSAWVEPIIAASIVFTAVASLRRAEKPVNAWKIAFLFGLVHGLGFASILNDIQLTGRSWFGAVLGFNLGIEFAQVVLVCLVLPLLWRVQQLDRAGNALRGMAGITCLISTYWLWERLQLYWFH
jgi:hydrogenase/urease accessory protein HupE